jgi:hypothetical protein
VEGGRVLGFSSPTAAAAMAQTLGSVAGASWRQGISERGRELEVTGKVEAGSKTHLNSLIWSEELSVELDGSSAAMAAAAADLGENRIEPDLSREEEW